MNSVYFCGLRNGQGPFPLQRVNSLFPEAHQQMTPQYQLHSAASPASMQTFTVAERLAGELRLTFNEAHKMRYVESYSVLNNLT